MTKQFLYNIVLLLSLLFAACDDGDIHPNPQQSLVVEGWIENGEFPIVIVTKTLPISDDYQNMDNLFDHLVRWAKVTISDGENSVVLSGRYDDTYYPPYVYTTSYMRGELGKTYSLTVEYEGQKLTAQTTIPNSLPVIDQYKIEPCAGSDTQYQITACFHDNPKEKNYYVFFTKIGLESNHYLGAYLGAVDDAMIDGAVEYPVYQGNQYNVKDYTPYFESGEIVSVKFAQVDKSCFDFWDRYTKSQSLNSNMFLSTSTSLPCNIEGGLGYWSGFAAVASILIIK